jgi:hypothetical protein
MRFANWTREPPVAEFIAGRTTQAKAASEHLSERTLMCMSEGRRTPTPAWGVLVAMLDLVPDLAVDEDEPRASRRERAAGLDRLRQGGDRQNDEIGALAWDEPAAI